MPNDNSQASHSQVPAASSVTAQSSGHHHHHHGDGIVSLSSGRRHHHHHRSGDGRSGQRTAGSGRSAHGGSGRTVIYAMPQSERSRVVGVLFAIFSGVVAVGVMAAGLVYVWRQHVMIERLEKEIKVQNEIIEAQKVQIIEFTARLEELSSNACRQ